MEPYKTVDIAFGRGHLTVGLPERAEATVIRKATLPKLADQTGAIHAAFDNPIDAPPLATLAQGRKSACILICDITRPVPNRLFLRPMIETMMAAGIPKDGITVLIATGLHRPNEGVEMAELVGDPWVLDNVRVENHFAMRDEDHVDLGMTATRETPVRIDRRFVEADLRIATGLVEPHFMAGWSGGRKVVAPASPVTRRSAPSIPPASWKTRWPFSAIWSATRCTRSSLRSSGPLARSMR